VTFAEYDQSYLSYLQGGKAVDLSHRGPFLTMYEVGPYNTQTKNDMSVLAPIFLALVLRADHEQEAEKVRR
jgi:hypothetical protein